MSPKEMYVNLEEMRRLQQRMTRISEDTNLLRQQFNGQVNSWNGVPSWGSITSAQQLLERLTREAEALSDLPRNVIAGIERVGQENERNRGVWANGLAALSRLLGTQARGIGFVAHVSSAMRRAATHLVSRITDLPGREMEQGSCYSGFNPRCKQSKHSRGAAAAGGGSEAEADLCGTGSDSQGADGL